MKGKPTPSTSPQPAPLAGPMAGETVQRAALKIIHPNPWNRTIFSETGLQEMEDSARVHGIIQPLICRPHPGKKGEFQIGAGERRWRGATRAKLSDAPIIVREYDDRKVREVMDVENLQRENPDPVEQGKNLSRHMAEYQTTAEQLRAQLGVQKSTFYGKLKLAKLCDDGAKLYRAGKFSESVAQRIARIPGDKMQRECLKELERYGDRITDRTSAEIIERNFMKELKGAPFDTKDKTLPRLVGAEPKASEHGDCASCPLRAGNQPDFDPRNGRADICLNPLCYRGKCDAAFAKQAEQHKAKGGEVADSSKAFDKWGSVNQQAGFRRADERCYDVDPLPGKAKQGSPTYAQLAAHLKIPAHLGQDPRDGEILTLLHKPTLLEAAKKAGLKVSSLGSGGSGAAAAKAAAAKAKRESAIKDHIAATTVPKAGSLFDPEAKVWNLAGLRGLVKFCVTTFATDASADQARQICRRRKVDLKRYKNNANGIPARAALLDLAKNISTHAEAFSLLFDLAITPRYEGFCGSNGKSPLRLGAEFLGLDWKKLEDQAKQSLDAAKAEKTKPKGKGTRPPKPTGIAAKILDLLNGNGAMTIKAITEKLKLPYRNVQVWFATSGKQVVGLKKTAPATYTYTAPKRAAK